MQADVERLRRQGWWNVVVGGVAWTLIIVMPAVVMPILYGPIMDDTGWSRGQVVLFSSIKFGVGGVLAFFLGHIIDRLGLRTVMLTGILGTAAALASLSFVDNLWGYYLAAALIGVSILCCATGTKVLVSRWFSARIGLAVGTALTVSGLMGVVGPISATALNSVYGWRTTALIAAGIIVTVMIPLYLLRARESPLAYGRTPEEIDPPTGRAAEKPAVPLRDQPVFADLLRTRAFWVVLIAHVLVGLVDHAMIDHLPLFLARDANLGPTVAALGLSITVVAGALGKIGFGWLFDRYSVKAVALCWASMAVGILLAFPVAGLVTFALFTLVRGASHGGVLVDVPICAKHLFGYRAMSKTIAVFAAANSLGGAIGTGGVGFMHDATGSYASSFAILIVVALAAAAMIYRMPPRYWSRWPGAQPAVQSEPAGERLPGRL